MYVDGCSRVLRFGSLRCVDLNVRSRVLRLFSLLCCFEWEKFVLRLCSLRCVDLNGRSRVLRLFSLRCVDLNGRSLVLG